MWSVCREALVMVLAGVALGLPAVLFGSRDADIAVQRDGA